MSRKEIIAQITQELFQLRLEKKDSVKLSRLDTIINLIAQVDRYFLLADPNTTQEEWANQCFSAYIDDGVLLVFLSADDIRYYAVNNGFVTENCDPMFGRVGWESLCGLLKTCQDQGLLKFLRIYTKVPLYIDCPIERVHLDGEDPVSQFMSGEYQEDSTPPQQAQMEEPGSYEFKLLDEIRACLDTPEVAKRRKMDPSLAYDNPHTLVEKLLYANQIDQYALEDELELPGGFLTLYVKDRSSSAISKAVLDRLLGYFGLRPYLYQFAKYCDELNRELKGDPSIDCCQVKAATVHTKEPFLLESVRRGKTQDGYYVYEVKFRSEFRTVKFVVSSLYGYVEGKKYEIFDLPPVEGIPAEVAEPVREEKPMKPERTPSEILEDSVIAYFKKNCGDTAKTARKKFAVLAKHPDIQMEFAKFAQTGRPGRIKVREYSARKLVKELGFEPYEAYIELCLLRDKPSETAQFLKYRETDPQYQKAKA